MSLDVPPAATAAAALARLAPRLAAIPGPLAAAFQARLLALDTAPPAPPADAPSHATRNATLYAALAAGLALPDDPPALVRAGAALAARHPLAPDAAERVAEALDWALADTLAGEYGDAERAAVRGRLALLLALAARAAGGSEAR